MPILWPLKVPGRSNAITQRKTLEIEHSCLFIHLNISFPSFGSHLFVLHSQNYAARALPILFNTPKKSLLKSSYPKKYLPNFRTQKNPGIKNFKPKKILRSSPSLEISSSPPGNPKLDKWAGLLP